MNGIRLSCGDVRRRACSRIRPNPLGCSISTAIATIALVCGLAPVNAALDPADVRLVDLDVTRQPLAAGTHHRRPVAVQHRPRRLVGAQPERALHPERRDAVLLAGHLPRRREPQPQRRPGAMEDRPRRHRRLTSADSALPPTAAQPPPIPPGTARTAEPVRPAQPLQVVQARSLVREPRQQLRVRARISPR